MIDINQRETQLHVKCAMTKCEGNVDGHAFVVVIYYWANGYKLIPIYVHVYPPTRERIINVVWLNAEV